MYFRFCIAVLFILVSLVLGESTNPIAENILPEFVGNTTSSSEQNSRHEEEYAKLQARLDGGGRALDGNHPRQRLLTALYGFSRYKERHLAEVQRWRSLYKNVSKKQKMTIESAVKYTNKLNTVEHLIENNDELALEIVQTGLHFYGISQSELDKFVADQEREGKKADRTSIAQAMKHYVRDWAEEGKEERDESFTYINNIAIKCLSSWRRVGRLAHEIARLNVYRQLTQKATTSNSKSYHPWLDWWSHHLTTSDMQRSVSFPDSDIDASSVLLVEGDFTTVFNGEDGKYDVIVTLFFIDTARNLLTYLETVHRLLRPGGTWLNLGPLLYGTAPFLQLSLDEIISLAEAVGFRFKDPGDVCGDLSLADILVREKRCNMEKMYEA
ncbi:hypothetical protein N7450_007846 [Penicillium hetheringtonii]|uniref:Uncharacterized protein n=1 Tax=Penicillium hetheringtonii TaxID=911720 RepID=A0AAD6DF78_9EURO|nr:hypothetical protein N7450_007846 [Penicillium hetheringtonii]